MQRVLVIENFFCDKKKWRLELELYMGPAFFKQEYQHSGGHLKNSRGSKRSKILIGACTFQKKFRGWKRKIEKLLGKYLLRRFLFSNRERESVFLQGAYKLKNLLRVVEKANIWTRKEAQRWGLLCKRRTHGALSKRRRKKWFEKSPESEETTIRKTLEENKSCCQMLLVSTHELALWGNTTLFFSNKSAAKTARNSQKNCMKVFLIGSSFATKWASHGCNF